MATITISEPASPTPEPTPVPTAEPTPEPTPQPTPEADNGEVVGLTLTSDTAGSLAIAWNAPSPEPDSYRVVWAEESLDFLAYRNNNEANRGNEYPSGNATSITLDGLTKSDTFKVRARARYASGGQNGGSWSGSWSGPWIDVVTARVKDDPPPAPTGLIAGAVSHDTVTLTWDDPQDSRITGYRVQRGPNAGSLSVIAEDTGSSAASYTDDTVSAETTYHYAVQAITQDGAGPPAAVIVTTLGDPEQPDSAEQGDRTERQTPDTTAPMVASAAANGASLVITFDEDLAAASALANSRRPPAGSSTEETVTLSATAPAISGMTVTLTLATALAAGDTEVKVSYAQPSSGSNNKLADGDGNLVASFTDQAVTNNTPSTDPFLSALTVSPRNIIGFRSDRISYEVGVASTVTTATITPTTNHSAATVAYSKTDEDSGADGLQFTLSAGRNEVTVTVTAEDGVSTLPYTVSVNQGVTDAYGWKAGDDFDGVREGTPQTPGGIWSNGTTMWVTDWSDREIDAYLVSDGSRDSANDFNSLIGNSSRARATSIWSDGETMWVAFDGTQSSIFAYRMSNMTRNTSKDFNTLAAEGNQKPWGIWSDGTTMWVSDYVDDKIYAYSMSERTRDETTEFDNLGAAGISDPRGVWSDGFTMWVLYRGNGKIYAFRMSDKGRDATRDFNTLQAAGNTAPTGFWSDGETVWAVDRGDNKLYAYNAAPLYLGSAGAKDTALTLTFSRKLATATLANTAFTVKKTPAGSSTEETVTLSATAPAISGKTVTLTLATAVAAGDTGIKVTYTKPATGSSNKITDSNGNEFASFADQAVTNNTLPVVASAAANGTALVITFDDDLASAAMLANDAFTVKKTPAGSTTEETVILSATAPAISGKTVTLTLATALAAGDTGVKVSYAQPSSGANNKLADADGNLVASFTDQTVTNNTPQGTDATLSALTVSPRNIIGFRSDLKSYHVGVASTVTTPTVTAVTTHPHATVAFTPATDADTNADGHQMTLSAGGNMVTVTVTAEDTTTTETYTLTINRGAATTYGWKASEDLDGLIGAKSEKPWSVWSDGTNMWVADGTDDKIYAYNWPDGGRDSTKDFNTLTAAGNAQPGDIWSDGTTMWVVDQTDHKVYSYNHPFLFLSATGNGTSLVLTFNRDLAAASGLVNSAFTIKKTPGMGMEETVALTGSPAISGRTVTLTLAMALVDTDTNIKVSYAKPSTGSNNKIADADGNEAASFTDRPGIKTSTDATLSALTVSPRDIDGFTSDRETYEVGVASTVATATVTATVNDSTATVAFTTATDADTNTDGHQVNLSAGRNTVTVEVTAEDTMTTRTYTVSINRGAPPTTAGRPAPTSTV